MGCSNIYNEVLGPVAVVKTFGTVEEVLEVANDSECGIMGGLFTKNITRALLVSAKVNCSVVRINCVSYVSLLYHGLQAYSFTHKDGYTGTF